MLDTFQTLWIGFWAGVGLGLIVVLVISAIQSYFKAKAANK